MINITCKVVYIYYHISNAMFMMYCKHHEYHDKHPMNISTIRFYISILIMVNITNLAAVVGVIYSIQ